MGKIFEDDYFHVGSDEPNRPCWNTSKHVRNWIDEQGMSIEDDDSFVVIEKHFNEKRRSMVHKAKKREIAWDDILEKDPPSSVTIQ
eukprot:Awhi_evm1s8263